VTDTRDAIIADLSARLERFEEALTPSGDTKAAYSGEFFINKTMVPWTTIKEIMKMIRERGEG
jgi:hypothetical protein